jgi:hypothetical protein
VFAVIMQKSFYYNSAKNARIYKKSIDFSQDARKWKYIPKEICFAMCACDGHNVLKSPPADTPVKYIPIW